MALWLFGATALWIVEGAVNPGEFGSLRAALWNIAVYLLSGLDTATPQTAVGKAVVSVMLIFGIGVVAVFTGTIASILVERRIGRKKRMPDYELKDHLVICNWNEKGVPIVQELHAPIVPSKRPIVVVSDRLEDVDLPEKDESPAFEDVYLLKGNPSDEIALRRANVHYAFSVIVLADPHEGHLADAKNVLTCLAIKNVCRSEGRPVTQIMVEGQQPGNVEHLFRAGAAEVVSAEDFGLRLLAQTALHPGLSHVYKRLLTISAETNEVYLVPVPRSLRGKSFLEAQQTLEATRETENPTLLLGAIRGETILINPRPDAFDTFDEGDRLVVIAWEKPSL